MLGKETGNEIPTRQMQCGAIDKEIDQNDGFWVHFRGYSSSNC